MPGVFISHASADKVLVDPFVDFIIRLGCGVPPASIFYSSGEDTRIPSGRTLNDYIRSELDTVSLVIAVISPAFQARPYCVAELGAAWSHVGKLFPVAIPGMQHTDMDGVLTGLLVRSLSDSSTLDELHDVVSELPGAGSNTKTWGRYKAKWMEKVDEYARKLTSGTPYLAHPSVAYPAPYAITKPDESYPTNPVQQLKSLNWVAQRVCVCCFTERSKNLLSGDAEECLRTTRQLSSRLSYYRLVEEVTYFISELIPGTRRFAIYHGNQNVLVPFHASGWEDSDPPILQSRWSSDQGVLCSEELLIGLRRGRRIYVRNMGDPPGPEDPNLTTIPGAQQFKSLAIVPIRAFPSFAAAKREDGSLLLGAILVQHMQADALHDERDREVLSLLGSLLAAALVHLAAREDNWRSEQ